MGDNNGYVPEAPVEPIELTVYTIYGHTLGGIADAIRNKTGETRTMTPKQMAESIMKLNVRGELKLEGLTVTPTGEEIVKVPPTGVDGFGIVTVEGDQNLTPENIKEGISVYGVVGTHSDGIDTSDATATPDDLMKDATAYVNGVKITGTHVCKTDPILEPLYVTPTGQEFTETPPDGVDGFNEVLVEGDYNLAPENIKAGVTIYGVEGTLAEPNLQSKEVTPKATDVVVRPDEEYAGLSDVRVLGDSNLIAENIKKGVVIFEVTGTLDTTDKPLVELNITPKATEQTITPSDEQLGFNKVIVAGDKDLIPSNVIRGVNIFGISGSATRNETFIWDTALKHDNGFIYDASNAIIDLTYREETT